MHFRRVGKTYQLRIETPDDLEAVLSLDESLWVATSAPAAAFGCDAEFLRLLDTDANGRLYTHEIREGIQWLLDRLADRSVTAADSDALPLSAVRDDTPEGQALLESATYILNALDAEDREQITLQQVRELKASLRSRPLNGDGIIRPRAAEDPNLAAFIQDVVKCTGGVEVAGGERGINEETLDRFLQAAADQLAWRRQREIPRGQTSTTLMPLGEDTPAAFAVYQVNAERVNLFFSLCRALQFAPGAEEALARPERPLQAADPADAESVRQALQRAPLARPTPEAQVPLAGTDVNPAYRAWLADLKAKVLVPLLGEIGDLLGEAEWRKVRSALAPYAAHEAQARGTEAAHFPTETLRAYLDGPLPEAARDLIAADRQAATHLAAVTALERLVLYSRHLLRLVNNFVSFPELYSPKERALFEMGSAVIDGRWFNFAVRVNDLDTHERIAKSSNIFVIYLEISKAPNLDVFHVAVPATGGARGNLEVGKRGVFLDNDSVEYDARVVRIVENPISLGEALAAPFKRVWSFFARKIEALSAQPEKRLDEQLTAATAAAAKGAAGAAGPAAPASAGATLGGPVGLLVGGSVAVAALGSAFAYTTKSLAALETHQVALGLVGLLLVVLLPVGIMAWMKLRRQDLSTLLEGCGWAINARMRLTGGQRRQFTRSEPYPRGATGTPLPRWLSVVVMLVLTGAIITCLVAGARAWLAYRKAHPPPPPKAEKSEPPPAGAAKVPAPKK